MKNWGIITYQRTAQRQSLSYYLTFLKAFYSAKQISCLNTSSCFFPNHSDLSYTPSPSVTIEIRTAFSTSSFLVTKQAAELGFIRLSLCSLCFVILSKALKNIFVVLIVATLTNFSNQQFAHFKLQQQ